MQHIQTLRFVRTIWQWLWWRTKYQKTRRRNWEEQRSGSQCENRWSRQLFCYILNHRHDHHHGHRHHRRDRYHSITIL